MEQKNSIHLKCKKCGHEWDYTGKNPYYATCPFCLRKVKVVEYKGELE